MLTTFFVLHQVIYLPTHYLSKREGKDYDAYAKARNQAKWEIRKAKREYEKKIAMDSKNNPKSFLSMQIQN